MGLSKRIWIDRDPAYAEVRQKYAEEAWERARQFTFRGALKRQNKVVSDPHWDPIWRNTPYRAAQQLGIEHITINDGIFFRTAEARQAVMKLAERLWLDRIEQAYGTETRKRLEPFSFT